MAPYWSDRRSTGYLERLTEFTAVLGQRQEMVAWTGYHLVPGDPPAVYVDSTGVVPGRQSAGLMTSVLRHRLGSALREIRFQGVVSARSESPVFYRLLRKLFGVGAVYPMPNRTVPNALLRSARDIAAWLGQDAIFDSHTLRLTGAYSNLEQLYGEIPSSGVGEIDEFFRTSLGPLDAFIIVVDVARSSMLTQAP